MSTMLGRYRLVTELARGGMGIVWLAEARGPHGFRKTCVVKELLSSLVPDPRHRAMFLDEAQLAARLSHRNIVQTIDFGEEGGRLFMVLELLEGVTLRRVLTLLGKKRLRPALAARIVVEALTGLDYVHRLKDDDGRSLGVVHRDISPSNVFLCFDGQVKLLDFGVAKSREHREKTREGFVKGTAAYMSPDHVSARPIDVRADVFTAGILLRELLEGARLWGDSTDKSILCHLIAGEVPPFASRPDVPDGLRRICERAMAPERENRFASAHAMANALDAWLVENDRDGSLEDLATMFESDMGHETVRVRMLHRTALTEAARAEPNEPIELPSDVLVTDASVRLPLPRAPWPKEVRLMLAMAILATLAAVVSATALVLDDDAPPKAATSSAPQEQPSTER